MDTIHYPVGGGAKTVHYWLGVVLTRSGAKPNDEVDQARLAVARGRRWPG